MYSIQHCIFAVETRLYRIDRQTEIASYRTAITANKVRNNCVHYCTIFLYTFYFDCGMQIASETRL